MIFNGLDHVAVVARDPRRLAAWYCEVLGFEVLWENGAEPWAGLLGGPGGALLEVMAEKESEPRAAGEAPTLGLRHLAIRVSDFNAAREWLASKGISFVGECGNAAGGGNVLCFADPEGNAVQIVSRPEGFRPL